MLLASLNDEKQSILYTKIHFFCLYQFGYIPQGNNQIRTDNMFVKQIAVCIFNDDYYYREGEAKLITDPLKQ
jgi:hypothetical protein